MNDKKCPVTDEVKNRKKQNKSNMKKKIDTSFPTIRRVEAQEWNRGTQNKS